MSDPTDLSKLSSTEIIAKIVNLALGCDGVWMNETNARLHALTVVLKQAVIREASAGLCYATDSHKQNRETDLTTSYHINPGPYELIPKEIP